MSVPLLVNRVSCRSHQSIDGEPGEAEKGPWGAVFEPIFPLARQKCWEPSAAIASRRSRMAVKGACQAVGRRVLRSESLSLRLSYRCTSSAGLAEASPYVKDQFSKIIKLIIT